MPESRDISTTLESDVTMQPKPTEVSFRPVLPRVRYLSFAPDSGRGCCSGLSKSPVKSDLREVLLDVIDVRSLGSEAGRGPFPPRYFFLSALSPARYVLAAIAKPPFTSRSTSDSRKECTAARALARASRPAFCPAAAWDMPIPPSAACARMRSDRSSASLSSERRRAIPAPCFAPADPGSWHWAQPGPGPASNCADALKTLWAP